MTYKPNGIPLTDFERELLVILMEECAEVIQAASKLVRFGKENRPDNGESNVCTLSVEYGEVLAVAEMVEDAGLIAPAAIGAGMDRKRERLAHFMQTRPVRDGIG